MALRRLIGFGLVALMAASTGAVALAGPSGPGAPVPESAQLRPVSDPDPDGGAPWGVRTFRTSTGAVCDQLGRVVDGKLGTVDQNGAFTEAPLRANGCSGPPPPNRPARSYGHSSMTTNVGTEGCEAFADPQPGRPRCTAHQVRTVFYGHLGPQLKRVLIANADWSDRRDLQVSPDGEYVAAVRGIFNDVNQPRMRLYFDGGCGPERDELLESWPQARLVNCQVVVALDEPRPRAESAASKRARRNPSRPSPVRVTPRSGHVNRRFRLRYKVPITVGTADGYTYSVRRISGPPSPDECLVGFKPGPERFQNYRDMVRGKWAEFLLSPGRDLAWCKGTYRASVSFVSRERTYRPFGSATFTVR